MKVNRNRIKFLLNAVISLFGAYIRGSSNSFSVGSTLNKSSGVLILVNDTRVGSIMRSRSSPTSHTLIYFNARFAALSPVLKKARSPGSAEV